MTHELQGTRANARLIVSGPWEERLLRGALTIQTNNPVVIGDAVIVRLAGRLRTYDVVDVMVFGVNEAEMPSECGGPIWTLEVTLAT